ncbi:MAG: hypothetical protein NC924_04500, partial [Candidatus Omnitrophica bacterium]|nr:hypothetical protein [Candidatus Omnitrophota bacterium]
MHTVRYGVDRIIFAGLCAILFFSFAFCRVASAQDAEKEKQKLQQQVEILRQKNEQLQEQMAKMKKTLQKRGAAVDEWQQEINKLTADLSDSAQIRRQLQQKIDGLQQEQARQKEIVDQLKNELVQLYQRKAAEVKDGTLLQKMPKLKESLETQEQEKIEELKKGFESTIAHLEKQKEEMERELHKTLGQVTKSAAQQAKLEKELQALKKKKGLAEPAQPPVPDSENIKLRQTVAILQHEQAQWQTTIKDLTAQNEQLAAELDGLRREIAAPAEPVKEGGARKKENEKIKQLQQENKTVSRQLRDAEQQIRILHKNEEKVIQALEQHKAGSENLKKENAALAKERQQLQERVAALESTSGMAAKEL